MKFHEAIKYMVENPGKEVETPDCELVFSYRFNRFCFFDSEENCWAEARGFDLKEVTGEWTLPQLKPRKVELFECLVLDWSDNSSRIEWVDEVWIEQFMSRRYTVTKLGPSRIVEVPSE